ncbi:transposase [Candidatus Palauibacter sp.]|uniref:transposase n=1 Tax=Candidatus Palauibacter sp. TaxID=3101350 RepID=UPI003B5B1D8D
MGEGPLSPLTRFGSDLTNTIRARGQTAPHREAGHTAVPGHTATNSVLNPACPPGGVHIRPKPSAVRRAIDAAGPHANLLSGRPKAEIGPLEVFYTDFTELVYADGARKAWLIPILDHRAKYVPGFAVGASANSDLALSAWTAAERTLGRLRNSLDWVIVHQDRDPVFTGYAWTGQLLSAGARLSHALRGPRDNPEMESFFGRFKVENRSLILDAGSLEELAAVVRDRIRYYNRVRRHSSLGDRPPLTIIEDFYREG